MQNNEEFYSMEGDEFYSGADAVTPKAAGDTKVGKAANTLKTINESGILQQAGGFLESLKKKPKPAEGAAPTTVQLGSGGGKFKDKSVKKDNTMLYVGIGAGVLALGVIGFLAFKK